MLQLVSSYPLCWQTSYRRSIALGFRGPVVLCSRQLYKQIF